MMGQSLKKLKVFLCHASDDKEIVRALNHRLLNDGIDAWLDDERLLPGQKWQQEIPKAVERADVVIVCISRTSITKEGYVQKEIKFALDIASEKPEGTIYLIPAKLEVCEVPSQLIGWQWVDLSTDKISLNDTEYNKLLRSLKIRADNIGAKPPNNMHFDNDTGIVVYRFADLVLNVATRQVMRGNRIIHLSKTQFQLLQLFMENPNQVLNQKVILENVWESNVEGGSNIVEVYIRYLRENLEAEGGTRLIHTVRGWGYVLRENK